MGRVTGEACYTSDVLLPGTLWAKVLRSPYAYARIAHIDATRAEKHSGVHAVLTGADVRGILYGRRYRDLSVLAQDYVRFVGEPVAAVAAVDRETAQAARDLITVDYEELPVAEGRVSTAHFGDYKIPTAKDIPPLDTVILEGASGVGPYRIKGIGENPQ